MKRYQIACVFMLWFYAGMFSGCKDSLEQQKQHSPTPQQQVTEVRTTEASIGHISNIIATTGSVFAIRETRIRPKVSGRIEVILVDEGEHVAKHQALIRLEQDDFLLAKDRAEATLGTANAALQQLLSGARREDIKSAQAAVSQARASLEEAKSDFERVKKLYNTNVASRQMYDTAKARYEIARQGVNIAAENLKKAKTGPTQEDVDVARARMREAEVGLKMAEQQLKDSTILAPFPGVVAERFMNEGEIVSSMSPSEIIRLVNIETVKIQCTIPEKEMSRVQSRGQAHIEVDAYPGEQFPGSITTISPVVDPASRTFKVTIEIPNTDHHLKPGMFARVQLITETHENVTLVPCSAITTVEGENVVFVAKDNIAQRRKVMCGFKNEQSVEIVEGIQTGEMVIIEGNYGLEDGTTIHVTATE